MITEPRKVLRSHILTNYLSPALCRIRFQFQATLFLAGSKNQTRVELFSQYISAPLAFRRHWLHGFKRMLISRGGYKSNVGQVGVDIILMKDRPEAERVRGLIGHKTNITSATRAGSRQEPWTKVKRERENGHITLCLKYTFHINI